VREKTTVSNSSHLKHLEQTDSLSTTEELRTNQRRKQTRNELEKINIFRSATEQNWQTAQRSKSQATKGGHRTVKPQQNYARPLASGAF